MSGFGDYIAARREALKLTQKDLAPQIKKKLEANREDWIELATPPWPPSVFVRENQVFHAR
jgi:hypothetical protein